MIDTRKILNEIDIANQWRLGELVTIKNLYEKLSTDKHRSNDFQKYILKSSIPMVYANLEGYIVSSLKIFFEALNKEKLALKDTHEILVTCSYEQKLKSLTDSSHFEKYQKHLKVIIDMFDSEIKFGTKIDTKSNLNFAILTDICKKLRFDISNFTSHEATLNQLVHVRNGFSHGENNYEFDKLEDIEKYFLVYDKLTEIFTLEIESFLENKKYLKY